MSNRTYSILVIIDVAFIAFNAFMIGNGPWDPFWSWFDIAMAGIWTYLFFRDLWKATA